MSKKVPAAFVLFVGMVAMLIAAAPAAAVSFEAGPGTYTVDTSTLMLTGPGTSIEGTNQGGVAVFSFDTVSIPDTAVLEVEGSRPLKIVSAGEFAIGGLIEGSGFDASNFVVEANAGGPGGAAGGASMPQPGSGPGGGGVASSNRSGAGGGGFGGTGAAGGSFEGVGGLGGSAYGNLEVALVGGSGGGGGDHVGGGGGGGAIALFGSSVRIVPSGEVLAEGGGGAVGGNGASGGGSGGGILIHADSLQIDGLLSAVGGEGGAGGCCGAGGGGGGGRIALQYKTLSTAGLIDVAGGTSGTRSSTSPYAPGTLGGLAGQPGVITKTVLPSPPSTPSTTTAPVVVPPVQKPSCVVPKLKGKKVAAVKKALGRAHCSLGSVKNKFSASVKKGRVIGSKPKAGKVLADGAKIGITVSKGPKTS